MSEMRLYDGQGNRLYLNAEERAAFLAESRRRPARDRTLCETLHYTGCRPSELIEIAPAWVDLSGNKITLRSLKKRKDSTGRQKIVYRGSVPVGGRIVSQGYFGGRFHRVMKFSSPTLGSVVNSLIGERSKAFRTVPIHTPKKTGRYATATKVRTPVAMS